MEITVESLETPALTKAQLGAMTADQIGAIEPIDMAVLTADKVAAFNPQALADGLVIYESNNPAGLPSKQMAALKSYIAFLGRIKSS